MHSFVVIRNKLQGGGDREVVGQREHGEEVVRVDMGEGMEVGKEVGGGSVVVDGETPGCEEAWDVGMRWMEKSIVQEAIYP